MPKSAKRSKKQRNNKKPKEDSNRAPARIIKSVPERQNSLITIRRATRRQLYWNPVTGIDGTGTTTMQLSFSPGATDYRLGGVSVYTDPLPNSTDFSNLFDQYKVKNVMIRIDYTVDAFNNQGVGYAIPIIYHVTDYDDPGDLTSSAMMEYPQVRAHCFKDNGYSSLMLSLKPTPLRDIAGSGIATGYAPSMVSPFLRTAEMTIPHYGLKFALNGAGASVNAVLGYFNVIIWYDMEFTNPK